MKGDLQAPRQLVPRLAHYFKNLRFRNKLIASYLVVIIIPIFMLGMFSYLQSKKFLLKEAENGIAESIGLITQNLNNKFVSYDTILNFIVYDNRLDQMINVQDRNYFNHYVSITEVLDPLIVTVLNTNTDMSRFTIYTNNPNLTERTDSEVSIVPIEKIRKEPWFSSVIRDRKFHWLVKDGTISGYVTFMKPFSTAPLNLLCVNISYDKAFEMQIKKVRKYGIFIADSNGRILFSKQQGYSKPVGDRDQKKFLGYQSGEKKINGTKYILINNKISSTGWNLYFYSPVDAVTIDSNWILILTLLMILACLGVLLLIILVFSNTFVKRIFSLNRQLKSIEEGDLKIQVHSEIRDEIGELTNNVGNMLEKINTLIDEGYKNKIVLKEAELRALRSQINPHFLYNTLSLINWKAITIDAMEISHITTNMSQFYRTILNNGKNVISVRDEIANIKSYIEIQLAFHKNSFDVEYHIEDDIYEYFMLNMTLQPVVENAIDHGIDHKRNGKGRIEIYGYTEEEWVYIRIQDNGPGLTPDEMDRILVEGSKGYGLKNIQERIRIFFGEAYGLSIKSQKDEGTSVTVKLPRYIGK